jgi:hypothetical protein
MWNAKVNRVETALAVSSFIIHHSIFKKPAALAPEKIP